MTRIPASIALVRMKGLEPPRLSALDPKSSAATNYATSAIILQRYKFLIACPRNPFRKAERILSENPVVMYPEMAINRKE